MARMLNRRTKVEVEVEQESLDRIKELVQKLEEAAVKITEVTEKAKKATADLNRAVDKAVAQNRKSGGKIW